ncbi:MAG: DUF4384 domain-containing protein [Candidatus Cloacimonetes bacterium]|nr:DUF4384 domain-containing protein [Candidatus Cloacimonadota bacterium]
MKRIIIVVILVWGVWLYCMPGWYLGDNAGEYGDYVTGKGFAQIEDGDIAGAEARAKESAMRDVAESISCSVSGETISHAAESGSGSTAQMEEYFVSNTKVRTDLELMGSEILKTDKDKQNCYVLVGIKRSVLLNMFRQKIADGIKEIGDNFVIADEMKVDEAAKSIKIYERCLTLSEQMQADLKIYLYLNNWQNEFNSNIKSMPNMQQIEKELTLLSGNTPVSTDILVKELLSVYEGRKRGYYSFVIYPFEYEDTGFVSEFGNNFAELCASWLARECGWQRLAYKDQRDANAVLRGKILQSENGMHLMISGAGSSNELFVNKVTCENIGWDKIKPENLDSALANKLALYNEIQRDSRLQVDLQTDKMMNEGVVYYYGEEPKLLVRANKACFLRLMYIFADGTKTLLIDNYPIAVDQANTWVKIPFAGEICEPSGVEQLILQASTEKQPEVVYNEVDLGNGAYINVIETGIFAQVSKTRGLKLKKPEKEITEKVFWWTVFEK